MKDISWIILAWLALLPTTQAENLDSTPLPLSVKRFTRGDSIVEIEIPSDVKNSIVKVYPNSNKSNIKDAVLSGDLGEGGNDDLVIATDPVNTSLGTETRLVIFRGKPNGSYEYLAQSSNIEYGKVTTEIKNKSLYIFVFNNTLKEYNEEIYEFKYRNGGFFLIGKEVNEDVPEEGNRSNISTNYLTGIEIETDWKNNKKIDIGNYNGSWDKLFEKSIEVIKKFKEPFLLLTDGDTSIFESLKGKVTVLVQRCLWHIPYQAQYVLWSDGVKRKSGEWLHVVAELMEICAIRSLVDCPDTIKAMLESKRARLEKVIAYCRENKFKRCVSYLENASEDMFTALENRLQGKTTSRVERLFRTVNMRVNVSKWSTEGAMNVTKVRLAYYYNGFDA